MADTGEITFRSSGSTGDAKRIVRTAASLDADAAALVAAFPEIWAGRRAVASSVRPEHMYGALWRVRAPRIAGCAVAPEIVTSVEELRAISDRLGELVFVTTPSFLEKALPHPDFAALSGRIAAVVTSGSLLRAETSAAVRAALGVSPLEIYGSTEAGSVAFRRQSEGAEWTLCPGVEAGLSPAGGLVVDSPFAMSRPLEMSDAAEFTSPRRFRLGQRLDRRVKILEKYVSLDEVEAAIAAHPFAAAARAAAFGEGVERIGAIVVPSPEGVRAIASGTLSAAASALRRSLAATLAPHAVPRRIRFVREIPVNEQGKTPAAAVRDALAAWCQEPAVLSWDAAPDALAATLVFPPDMRCFAGHFPDAPILPGVAQLYFLGRFARQAFHDFPRAASYRRLKFQKVIAPGREVSLTVKRRGAGIFDFAISGANGPCASGAVEPAPAAGRRDA